MQKSTEMNIGTVSPSKWFGYAKQCIQANLPLMTWGKSGAGKSDMLQQLADACEMDYAIDVRLSVTDPSELKGVPVPVRLEDGTVVKVRWARDERLPTDPNAKVLIILDEINQPSPIIQAMAYQLVLDRRLGDYELPKGCRIMAAGNRVSDRGVTNTMPAPLRNRFVHVQLEPSVADFASWAIPAGVSPQTVAFVRFKQDQLHDFEPDMTAFPTPRSIVMMDNLIKGASQDLEFSLVEGCCGHGFAIEYIAFLKMWRSLPDLTQIEKDPDSVEIPEDVCVKFAMTGSIARMATAANMDNVIKFMRRMNREYQLICLTDIAARDQKLCKNQKYIELNCELANIVRS